MKTRLMVLVLAAAAVGGLMKWHGRQATDGRRNIVVNRFWVDHLPTGERDPFKVFVLNVEGMGAFADETQWKGQIERFRFDVDGNTVHAVFPWTDTREDIKITARPCQEQGMDYCLELSGSSRGVKRYYSRKGWTRRDGEDIEAFEARAFAH